MKFVTGFKKGAFLTLAAALAVIFAATIVMNALREYDAVRPVEFFIAPICAAAAALFIRENKTEGTLVVAALLSTTCADFFMVILEDFYLISLTFFSAAQLLYYARILLARAKEGKKYIAASVCIRAAVSIAVCAAAPFVVPQAGALAAFAAFYFINLAANCAEACVLCVYVKGRGRQTIFSAITFAAGLALFVGCDVCVALNVARVAGITLGDGAIYAVNILIWTFYAPSQAALALSATVRLNKSLNEEPLGAEKRSCDEN